MRRFFIASYYFSGKKSGYGDIAGTTNTTYINKSFIIKEIKKQHDFIDSVAILNIIELNENDFNDYKNDADIVKVECL